MKNESETATTESREKRQAVSLLGSREDGEMRADERTVLDEMVLCEAGEALAGGESLSDEHRSRVRNLLTLERSPSDDAE